MKDYGRAVAIYLQMWLRKLTLDEFALRSHIPRSTLHDIKSASYDASFVNVSTMSHWLKCPGEVILGMQPCTANCPHCEHCQP